MPKKATRAAREPKSAQLSAPSAAEQEAIRTAQSNVDARQPRLRVRVNTRKDGTVELLGGDHNDHTGWLARLEDAFGTRGTAFAVAQLNSLISASKLSDGSIDPTRLNAMLAIVEGAKPANEVQALLAVQMAATHAAAQTVLARALRVDQIPQFDSAAGIAVKLLRTFTLQAETLAKLQRGGEQVVKVVHVHPGGQAIVGDVVAGKSANGGGGSLENFGQPHAKGELPAPRAEAMPQVWSKDSDRETLPLTSGPG